MYFAFHVLVDTPENWLTLFFALLSFVSVDVGMERSEIFLLERLYKKHIRREKREIAAKKTDKEINTINVLIVTALAETEWPFHQNG